MEFLDEDEIEEQLYQDESNALQRIQKDNEKSRKRREIMARKKAEKEQRALMEANGNLQQYSRSSSNTTHLSRQ